VPETGLAGRGLDEQVIQRFKLGWDPEADRVILPHFWEDALVGWQSRRIWSDGSQKYLSSPDFPKDRTIFNATDPLIYATDRPVVIVESMMTVYAHCMSWPVVATFGAEITDAQLRLLQDYRKIVTFFDNDLSGWKATERIRDTLDGTGPLVYSVDNPYTDKTDAGDLPEEEFSRLVGEALYCTAWRRPDVARLIDYEE